MPQFPDQQPPLDAEPSSDAPRSVPRQHGPWQILSSRQCYGDPWVNVRRDEVIRPDGLRGTYCVIDLKPGVSVLAQDDDGDVYLTQEFHYGVGRVTLEVVSGGIEPGEDPLATAQRELQEEIGVRARQWIDLGVCDPFTANVVSPTRLFLARELAVGVAMPDGSERIERVKLPLSDAVDKVLTSEITHAPSCLVILKAARWNELPHAR